MLSSCAAMGGTAADAGVVLVERTGRRGTSRSHPGPEVSVILSSFLNITLLNSMLLHYDIILYLISVY